MKNKKTLADLDTIVTIKEFKIKPPVKDTEELTLGEVMGQKLHPLYASKFTSIYGPTYSVKNLMSILKTTDKYFKYINLELKGKELSDLISSPNQHRDNYWGIIKLNMVDRLFKDKKLLDYLIKNYTKIFVNSKPVVYNNAKRGIMTVEVVDKITPNYVKIIKDIVNEVLLHTPNIVKLNKIEFKSLKEQIKNNILNDVLNNSKTENLISSVTDAELKEAYLK